MNILGSFEEDAGRTADPPRTTADLASLRPLAPRSDRSVPDRPPSSTLRRAALLGAALFAIAAAPPSGKSPATVEGAVPEGSLGRIRLTAEAEQRLAIKVAPIEMAPVERTRTVGGIIAARPGSSALVVAPFAGTVLAAGGGQMPVPGTRVAAGQTVLRLMPLVAPARDLQIQGKRDLEMAEARLTAAKANAERVTKLLAEGAADRRADEQARADLSVAQSETEAARSRMIMLARDPMSADVTMPLRASEASVVLRLLAAPQQTVSAGAPLFELANLDRVWVRVPVYVGDLSVLDRAASARVRSYGALGWLEAKATSAPPLGSGSGANVDLQYELDGANGAWTPGMRVEVRLALAGSGDTRKVAPFASILYDMNGHAWVYARVEPLVYARRPVVVDDVRGEQAVLHEGPPEGTQVVIAGGIELMGTELGIGK